MAGWGNDDEEIADDGSWGAGDQVVTDAEVFGPPVIPGGRGGSDFAATDPRRVDLQQPVQRRRGGTVGELRQGIGAGVDTGIAVGAQRPGVLPDVLLSEEDLRRRKKANEALYGADEASSAVASGWANVGALGQAGLAAAGAIGYGAIADAIKQFDAVDRGDSGNQASPAVQAYANGDAAIRQKLRERAAQQLAGSREFIADAAKAYAEVKKVAGEMGKDVPRMDDIESWRGFVNWASQAVLATSPSMTAVLLGAAAGGLPGLLAASGAMGWGDIASEGLDASLNRNDPKRFRSADRAADAADALPDNVSKDMAARTGQALLATPLYMAMDAFGPERRLASQGLRGATKPEALIAGAKALPTDMLKEGVGEGGQKAIVLGTSAAAGERPATITQADVKAVLEEGFTGAIAGGPMSAVATARDVYNSATPEQRIAREIQRNADNVKFDEGAIDAYARRASSPGFYDPNSVDPAVQREQFAADKGNEAPAGPQAASPEAPFAEAGAPPQEPIVPPIEKQPTTIKTPDEVRAEVAGGIRARAEHQAADAAASPDPEAILGIAHKRPGSLAEEAERALREHAQEAATGGSDVGDGNPPGGMAPGGGRGQSGDAVGGVGDTGRASAFDVRGGRNAGATGPGGGATAPVRGGTADTSLRGDDASVRTQFNARYDSRRARVVGELRAKTEEATKLRGYAAQWARAGLKDKAAEAEKKAGEAESQASQLKRQAERLPVLSAPPKHIAASFGRMQTAVQDAFGRRVVAYYDTRKGASDGFADGGVAFVNLANPERSVAFTVFHELQHLVRREAEAGDSKSRLATQMLDQVWALIDNKAKREYAQTYLFAHSIDSGSMSIEQALVDPKLRDEMLSDFMGKRATDEQFWRDLAQKNPEQFRSFAERWIDTVKRLLDSLLGRHRAEDRLDEGGVKDVDKAIVRLERAKAVAEKVLRAWADNKPAQRDAEPTSVSDRSESARAIVAEVAPHPDKPAINEWRKLDQGQRMSITNELMDDIWPRLMQEMGWPKATYVFGSGVFEGEINPNVLIDMPGASFGDMVEVARLMGYIFDQKAMVVFDEADKTDGAQAGFVKVIPPQGMTREKVDEMRAAIAKAVPEATGDTLRDGAIVYGNFSDLSDNEYLDAIVRARDALPSDFDGTDVVDAGRFRSEYIQPASRDAYLEGTRYGQGNREEAAPGRDGVRGRSRGDPARIRQIADRATAKRDNRVAFARRLRDERGGDRGGGGLREVGAEGLRRAPVARHGPEGQQDSISVEAYHYSQAERSQLSTAAYGGGLRGSNTDANLTAADKRLRRRAHFYVNKGAGLHPESGVGPHLHRVQLQGMYDMDSDPRRLLRSAGSRLGFEGSVLDAGFSGYVYRQHNQSAAAIVLGDATIGVEYVGPRGLVDANELGAQSVLPGARRDLSAAERIAANKSLPAGRLSGKRWAELVRVLMPAEFAEHSDSAVWRSDETLYRGELARKLQESISYSTREPQARRRRIEDIDEKTTTRIVKRADKKVMGASVDRLMSDLDGEYEVEEIVFDDLVEDTSMPTEDEIAAGAHDASTYRPSAAEMEQINEDLQREQGWSGKLPTHTTYHSPTDAELKAAGLMAESAYKPIEYGGAGARRSAKIVFERPPAPGARSKKEYEFVVYESEQGFSPIPDDRGLDYPNYGAHEGLGWARGLRHVPKATAEAYNNRIAASIDLERRGFDLWTTIPLPARKRVAGAWKTISGLKAAFRYKKYDPLSVKSMPSLESFNEIARQMLGGTNWEITAKLKMTDQGRSILPGWYSLEVTDKSRPGSAPQGAEIEFSRVDRRVTFHTINLTKGTGGGTPVYQVGYAWAHNMGLGTNADKEGLTGVNLFRRTEQMMSALARFGDMPKMAAGVGQRIYGLEPSAKTPRAHEQNLVRLALASARNVAESFPQVRDIAYDLADDAFTWRRGAMKGKSADQDVKAAIESPDARALGVGRSSVARAAITFAAIDNELRIDERTAVKSPILYSMREGADQYTDMDDYSGDSYRHIDGREVVLQANVSGTGQTATVTVDAGAYVRRIEANLETLRKIRSCVS